MNVFNRKNFPAAVDASDPDCPEDNSLHLI
jgi:hypothetical protein